MHRGGTSAVAGMFHRLGVNFGPRLMPANADNPTGYFEHNDVVNLHDRLLLRLDASWDSVFPPPFDESAWAALAPAPGLPTYREELIDLLRRDFPRDDFADAPAPAAAPEPEPSWGLKDPRLCQLLPWWEPVWAALDVEPCFILVLRSPSAVAASLGRRDGFSLAKSHLLWLQHTLAAERFTRGRRRCFLHYDRFLEGWRAAMDDAMRTLGISLPTRPENVEPAGDTFLSPLLRHHRDLPPPREGFENARGMDWVSQVWEEFCFRGTSGEFSPDAVKTLDAIGAGLTRTGSMFSPMLAEAASDISVQLKAQRHITRWYEAEWKQSTLEAKRLEERLAACRAKALAFSRKNQG